MNLSIYKISSIIGNDYFEYFNAESFSSINRKTKCGNSLLNRKKKRKLNTEVKGRIGPAQKKQSQQSQYCDLWTHRLPPELLLKIFQFVTDVEGAIPFLQRWEISSFHVACTPYFPFCQSAVTNQKITRNSVHSLLYWDNKILHYNSLLNLPSAITGLPEFAHPGLASLNTRHSGKMWTWLMAGWRVWTQRCDTFAQGASLVFSHWTSVHGRTSQRQDLT